MVSASVWVRMTLFSKLSVHIRPDVLRLAPTGRSVFFALTELLAVFAFHINRQLEQSACRYADEQVNRTKAGQRICKCCPEAGKAPGELVDQLSSGSLSEQCSDLVHKIEREHIREVEKNEASWCRASVSQLHAPILGLDLDLLLVLAPWTAPVSWASLRRMRRLCPSA